jgi:SP family sugar porter-like MFS transporter
MNGKAPAPPNTTYAFGFILYVSMVAALGGLLFGYDWVVIGGAKPFYERFFGIVQNPALQGWAMSSALVGCIAGALAAGFLSDRYGRKRTLILAAMLFTASAIGTGMANELLYFILYRLLGGLGIGLASTVSPMYISETSPAAYRGRFVSLNQLTIVIGILLAQIINWLIADEIQAGATNTDILQSWNGQMGWRWMFWAETVPAAAFFVLAFFIPESVRWLVKVGKEAQASAILQRVGGDQYAKRELHNIKETLRQETGSVHFKMLFTSRLRKIVGLGVLLAVLQQWCGINVIFNYAEEIFTSAGFGLGDMLFNIVLTGSVNLVFTFVAIRVVDHWGRRKLMLLGFGGLAVIYVVLGTSYFFDQSGWAILFLVVLAIACYAMTLAPVTWVVLSEIFPNRVRGTAMSVATFALWTACFVLTYTFPLLNSTLNASGTFWLYSAICLIGFFYLFKRLPETKGKSLEEIEQELTAPTS